VVCGAGRCRPLRQPHAMPARASVGLRLCAFFAATRATVAGLIISLSAQITGSLAHFPTPHRDVTLLFNLHLANKKSAGRSTPCAFSSFATRSGCIFRGFLPSTQFVDFAGCFSGWLRGAIKQVLLAPRLPPASQWKEEAWEREIECGRRGPSPAARAPRSSSLHFSTCAAACASKKPAPGFFGSAWCVWPNHHYIIVMLQNVPASDKHTQI